MTTEQATFSAISGLGIAGACFAAGCVVGLLVSVLKSLWGATDV